MMRLRSYAGAAEFLGEVQAFLERQEVLNGLMLGLAIRLVEEPLAYGSPPYLASVAGEEGLALAGLMTPPYNLILYSEQESAPEALELVARNLIEGRWSVSGTLGPAPLAQAFAGLWRRLAGTGSRPGMSQRLYHLSRVLPPRYSCGHLRQADEGDSDQVLGWMRAFEQEAMRTSIQTTPGMTQNRIAEGSVFLWDDDSPVCMAVRTRPTRRGVSISWVYTPPELRRRGYATSCVAALSQRLLDSGFEYCTLFTDLDNPTSNDIYQQIGYRPVCDYLEIKFTDP
jgi:predicted GNAT family acetyltransferase